MRTQAARTATRFEHNGSIASSRNHMACTPPTSARCYDAWVTILHQLTAAGLLLLGLAAPATTQAQNAHAPSPPASNPWRRTAEANGTLLYGAASQRVLGAAIGIQRDDQRLQLRGDLLSNYGDALDQTTKTRQVIVRNSRASASVDLEPRATVSPFGFGSVENSLQQRFAARWSVGAGAKLTVWRVLEPADGLQQDASISVAMLAEQTRFTVSEPSSGNAVTINRRVRWSSRLRYRKQLTPAVRLTHLLWYQPTVNRIDRYTLEATTTLALPVTARTTFTLTHRERVDSEAMDRGAPSTRDGQLLFGLCAAF